MAAQECVLRKNKKIKKSTTSLCFPSEPEIRSGSISREMLMHTQEVLWELGTSFQRSVLSATLKCPLLKATVPGRNCTLKPPYNSSRLLRSCFVLVCVCVCVYVCVYEWESEWERVSERESVCVCVCVCMCVFAPSFHTLSKRTFDSSVAGPHRLLLLSNSRT